MYESRNRRWALPPGPRAGYNHPGRVTGPGSVIQQPRDSS